jgi:protein-L-isoaspartate(D-aspartate) O-methyltransferase
MNPDRALRERLVAHLERIGVLASPAVVRALLAVPRHHFVPLIPLEAAYDDRALAIKERDGHVLSSISQPSMVVQMLQLLEVQPTDRVLEIGTGSGYNAALLATLAGPHGAVVTVDLESDLIDAARARIGELGLTTVRVMHADTLPSLRTTFSRIIVTARADDIEPEWWRLLEERGRMVVPMDLGIGGERAFGFRREAGLLNTVGSHSCAFIGLRNEGDRRGDIFFLSRDARYATAGAATPVEAVAMRRTDARTDVLEHADAVVARPTTLFAVNILAGQHNR